LARTQRQTGSSLILLLGIVATLAILASALVMVLANAQHNTLRERSQAKSFHVAEAALDAAMAAISPRWPAGPTATPVPFPTATFQEEFRPLSGESPEYPADAGAQLPEVSVTYFDNSDTNGDGQINALDDPWDANVDDQIYIVTQGSVLERTSRVQVLVQRAYFEPQVPSVNVLWCGGSLLNSGGGNGVMPKVTVEDAGPLANGEVSADVLGNIEDYDEGDPECIIDESTINVQFGEGPAGHDNPKTLEQAFPEAARQAIIDFAKTVGRYFDTDNAAQGQTPLQTALASPETAYGGPGLKGLTVIRQATGEYQLRDDLNTELEPGILMMLGGVGFDIGGNADFYGLLYVEDGTITVSHGTPTVHGAMFATEDIDFKGTCNLTFNYMALSSFSSERWGSTVNMVPNTWRELQPQ